MRADDPTCHFKRMRAAAAAGLAPHVWYTSLEDRLAITDFLRAVPLPMAEALVRMPNALRTLHRLPPFPRRADHLNTSCLFLLNKGTALDGFLGAVQAANIFAKREEEELFARHEEVAAIYPRNDADMVSSHNDLFKPDNILFDGRRIWLVDWEAAFLNDRYADLAVVANLVVTNEAEEGAYLQEYFGAPPDPYQRARFFLMQQLAHIFYAMVFPLRGSSDNPENRMENTAVQRLPSAHLGGRGRSGDSQTKAIYGAFHWEQLLHNTRRPRFSESLKIVGDRNASRANNSSGG
jgi:hypothetical protein